MVALKAIQKSLEKMESRENLRVELRKMVKAVKIFVAMNVLLDSRALKLFVVMKVLQDLLVTNLGLTKGENYYFVQFARCYFAYFEAIASMVKNLGEDLSFFLLF